MQFECGDHIVSPRLGGLYKHHGLYIGNDEIIHYSGLYNKIKGSPIIISSVNEFLNGNSYEIITHSECVFSVDEIISRAKSRLGEDSYCVLQNNCEHFVNWCITGKNTSIQVKSAIKTAASIAGIAIVAGMVYQHGKLKNTSTI